MMKFLPVMSIKKAELPEGITNASKLGSSVFVSFNRDVNPSLVLELASHFSEWNYGPGVEYGQGGERQSPFKDMKELQEIHLIDISLK